MVLLPIRMKPEHPSTALPKSSRIHFGRAYEIRHLIAVKSLGLIHAASMETLISQSERHLCMVDHHDEPIETEYDSYSIEALEKWATYQFREPSPEPDVIPADMEVVKDIRNNIQSVLGKEHSLLDHKAPDEPVLGIGAVAEENLDARKSEGSRELKRGHDQAFS